MEFRYDQYVVIKNKYTMRRKKIHAVKYIFNKKSYLKLRKKIKKTYNLNFQ